MVCDGTTHLHPELVVIEGLAVGLVDVHVCRAAHDLKSVDDIKVAERREVHVREVVVRGVGLIEPEGHTGLFVAFNPHAHLGARVEVRDDRANQRAIAAEGQKGVECQLQKLFLVDRAVAITIVLIDQCLDHLRVDVAKLELAQDPVDLRVWAGGG